MRYEGQIYRPFSEANSYLLQCTIGCSHNRCTFCGMYKDRNYSVRSLSDIIDDIHMAKDYYGDLEKVFLCDGDAIALDTEILTAILKTLYASFPSLRHVGSYVGPDSTLKKSRNDLDLLRKEGLTKVYLGVESGDEQVLKEINKGVSPSDMLEAGKNLVEAGFNLSSMVLLGIAGTGRRAVEHAIATAELTNMMKPSYLAALTYTPVPNTALFSKYQSGEFVLPDPFETLEEMKLIFDNITIENLKFIGAHASNYLPISGTLQTDKESMLSTVNRVLESKDMDSLRAEEVCGL